MFPNAKFFEYIKVMAFIETSVGVLWVRVFLRFFHYTHMRG